jgi:hypothetical protein
LVLILSKGKEPKEADIPAVADAINLLDIVYLV